jgi:hypothetical protein
MCCGVASPQHGFINNLFMAAWLAPGCFFQSKRHKLFPLYRKPNMPERGIFIKTALMIIPINRKLLL